jgi:Family of unknown function (DUF5670)
MQWKIKVGDSELSADSTETMKQWYSEGRIRSDSYVYHPVLEKWMYVRDLEELRVSAPWEPAPARPAVSFPVVVAPSWNPGVAALLSLVIPGAGQMYKGQVGVGLVWLVVVVAGYFMLLVPGAILHLVCIFNAATGKSSQRTSQAVFTPAGGSSQGVIAGAGTTTPKRGSPAMLLGVVFLIIWAGSFFGGRSSNPLIHVVLVLAIILLIVGQIQRRPAD